MQAHQQAAVEGAEQHAVAAVLGKHGLGLLFPRAGDLAGGRPGHAHGVALFAEAGPQHEQGAVLGAEEERAVGDNAVAQLSGVPVFKTDGPRRGGGVEQGDGGTGRRLEVGGQSQGAHAAVADLDPFVAEDQPRRAVRYKI